MDATLNRQRSHARWSTPMPTSANAWACVAASRNVGALSFMTGVGLAAVGLLLQSGPVKRPRDADAYLNTVFDVDGYAVAVFLSDDYAVVRDCPESSDDLERRC